MNRGRAETHLRQLAEAELRRGTAPGTLGRGHAGRLPLVAQALIAVGAVDVGTADAIQADLDLALAARHQAAGATPQQLARLIGIRPPRAVTETLTAPRRASWRVVPVGQVIRIRDGLPIRSSYTFVPLVTCESFAVRVRFDPRRPPRSVWRLDRVPPSVLADPPQPGPSLPLDGACEVAQDFAAPQLGYAYGLRWLAEDDSP